ncbi:sodium/calcium exchanger NCL-like [Henckelia pumila]|uniref:sodium/calcium exchanger NCL-like n=1 Tax=Henckelia pumila TaxID=405737 RepID=UPI003C6E4953
MAALALKAVILILLSSSIAQGRIIKLKSSSDHLISDGVSDHVADNKSSSDIMTSSADSPPPNGGCRHQYGFLPCAENGGGFIFQIIVYQGLLIYGEKQLGKGSKVLFNILGTGKFGGIIFRILMALPSMMLMIVSGVFMSKENAASQVSVGVGIYAGMTVFGLTLQWGICVIVGRRDLPQKSTTDHIESSGLNCLPAKEKLMLLRETGVTIDRETRTTAGIMLLSLIPYITVQLVNVFKNLFENRLLTLIALLVAIFSLLSYFLYQILNPWIQERSLDYSKYELLRAGFLKHVGRLGDIVNEDGKLNTTVIKKLFADTDKDENKCITKTEIEKLVLEIIESGKMKVDNRYAVSEIMNTFDFDSDMNITEQEFVVGCRKWIDETKSSEHGDSGSGNIFHELFQLFKERKEDDPREIDRIMSKILKHAQTQMLKSESLITEDGRPNIERIRTLFKQFDRDENKSISKSELEQLISTVKFGEIQQNVDIVKELFKDFDQDNNSIIDEPEFVAGVSKWLKKAIRVANASDQTKSIDEFDKIVWKQEVHDKWALMISVVRVLFGIVVLTFLGGPLMESILGLSYSMSLPSFCISFVIVPLAMNARALIAAILPASRKSERSASLTFSEIYGGVIMNNISGLTTLLAIVYAKDLTWDYSAEVLTVIVVCAIIGIMAYSCTTYPLWTCLLAFLLYPFSLGLYCFVQFFWSWK